MGRPCRWLRPLAEKKDCGCGGDPVDVQSLDVLSGVLKQAEAAALSAKKTTRDARGAVMAHYERGVAQLAQLFPVFFVFESAWWTFAVAALRGIYHLNGCPGRIRTSRLPGQHRTSYR